MRQHCLGVPKPRFRIGQRVYEAGFSEETGDFFYEEGVILGIAYNWPDAPGWSYWVQYDTPRTFEDDAREIELTPVWSHNDVR